MVRNAGWVSLGCAAAAAVFWLLSTVFNWQTSGVVDGLTTLLPVPITFACGYTAPRLPGLIACAAMIGIGEAVGFNPFVIVIVFGPWLAGTVLRERQRVTRRLEEVGRELEAESRLLAEEAVKLERARIARELHDIVAHCVSVMVIQAYAGERLMPTNEGEASKAFEHIAGAAAQAQQEIVHLVALLDRETETPFAGHLDDALRRLAAGASAAGLNVRLHLAGDPDQVPTSTAVVVYRIVQEGVTNALKHSPGAPIVIAVDCTDEVAVDVLNGSGTVPVSGLGSAGGGHGLRGVRDRVAALGGAFTAGPEPGGAWRISVRLPRS
jgi:signal transduction histidine kinase